MAGLFGTEASLLSDVSLILVWAFLLMAGVGYFLVRRRRFPTHCSTMLWAALLNWLPVLLVMVVRWIQFLIQRAGPLADVGLFTPAVHAVAGGVTQILMTYTVVRMQWRKKWPPRRSRWLMRITLILWAISVVGGTLLYLNLYVL